MFQTTNQESSEHKRNNIRLESDTIQPWWIGDNHPGQVDFASQYPRITWPWVSHKLPVYLVLYPTSSPFIYRYTL